MRTHESKIYSRELVEMIFTQPYCRIQNLVDAGIAKRQTASVYLKSLESIGVLKEMKVGREKLFIHPAFVKLLTSDDHPVLQYAKHIQRDFVPLARRPHDAAVSERWPTSTPAPSTTA
jgi:hypothetical protein